MVSILIVNWNTREDVTACLASVYAHPPAEAFEVLVVDNASSDGSAEAIAQGFPAVRLLRQAQNLGFARGNNRAAAAAQGRYWLLLNPDTLLHAGAIDSLVRHLDSHPRAAAVGPRLLNPDGSLQPSIQRLPSLFREWWRLAHLDRMYPVSEYRRGGALGRPRAVEVLSGACLLLRPEALGGEGLFDEDYFVYSEEIDLCDRLKQAGWDLHWVPAARVTHKGGRSTSQVADAMFLELYRNKVKFFRKRRGAVRTWLYKLILLQAAMPRWLLGQAARGLPMRQRAEWQNLARQYRLLLANLARL